MDKGRLILGMMGQLESELTLGGRWLPVGKINLTQPAKKKGRGPMPKTKGDDRDRTAKGKRLAQVAVEIAACQRCPLYETRHHSVPGEGNPSARLVFVGEAPGEKEDNLGRPFVGRAGQLLTKIIEAMGLKREEVFICNILKSRPPGNRDPLESEITACIGYLHQQLEIIDPEVIVALGAHAARTLLETSETIGRLRGQIHSYQGGSLSKPIKLIATYHPAYLLRNYSQETRGRVWEDMQRVLGELGLAVPVK